MRTTASFCLKAACCDIFSYMQHACEGIASWSLA
jgi:hypothetical protein